MDQEDQRSKFDYNGGFHLLIVSPKRGGTLVFVYQAKFSNSYLLLIKKEAGETWSALLNGPCSIKDQKLCIGNLEDARRAAYEFAERYFMEKGIAEPRIPRAELKWE